MYVFDDIIEKNKEGNEEFKSNPNDPTAEQILKTYETVYLFKWFFPEEMIKNKMREE